MPCLPRAKRIAPLADPDIVSNLKPVGEVRAASAGTGINLRLFEATTRAAPGTTLAAIAQHRPDRQVVVREAMFIDQYQRVCGRRLISSPD